MTTAITIYPEPSPTLHSARQHQAPDIVNNDFLSGFSDLLDAINPLQHIPIVSNIYRELTGDKISTGAQLAGDTLFGGPLGFIASLVNSIFEQETGSNVTSHVVAAVTGKYEAAAKLPS